RCFRLPPPGFRHSSQCRWTGRRRRLAGRRNDLRRLRAAGRLAAVKEQTVSIAEAIEEAVPCVLRLDNIRKVFGGIVAIENATFDLNAGEVTVLVGDNGAGKSTLVKIICGVHPATSGRMLMDGEEVSFADPSSAQKRGIQ